eukprot:100556-Amphidinium_carterae.1
MDRRCHHLSLRVRLEFVPVLFVFCTASSHSGDWSRRSVVVVMQGSCVDATSTKCLASSLCRRACASHRVRAT